jgi:AcrR family transcriptional regulator
LSQRREGDTKAEIRAVALELFTERGYDATSLREIAERLGITKAALYYHYRNKEDIIHSLLDAYLDNVDELRRWAQQQERTPATRAEALARWTDFVRSEGVPLTRFLHNNQQAIREIKTAAGNPSERLTALFQALEDPSAPLVDRLRMRMAFLSLHVSTAATRDLAIGDAELMDAAGQIARELLQHAEAPGTA